MVKLVCPHCGDTYAGHHMRTACDKPECKEKQADLLKKTRYEHQISRRQNHPESEDRRCPLCDRAESKCQCRCPDCNKPMYEQVTRYEWRHHVRAGPKCKPYDPLLYSLNRMRCPKWYRRRLKIVRQIKYSNFVEVFRG